MKLTEAQRFALGFLARQKNGASLATCEDHGVHRNTLDSLTKKSLIDFGGGEFVSVAATVEHFRTTQLFGLWASITDLGRRALAEHQLCE